MWVVLPKLPYCKHLCRSLGGGRGWGGRGKHSGYEKQKGFCPKQCQEPQVGWDSGGHRAHPPHV